MNIRYNIYVRDEMGGCGELLYSSHEDIYEAIAVHQDILNHTDVLRGFIATKFKDYAGEIDQYYINNPYKRFDVTLEVDYREY